MKRFLLLFLLGALTILGGQIWLSVVLHPAAARGLAVVLAAAAAVALGSAMTGAAMLGIAETYEAAAAAMAELLETKEIPERSPPVCCANDHLAQRNRSFWRSYVGTSLAISAFLLGLLAISIALGASTYLRYLAGISGAGAVLGALTLLVGARALLVIKDAHGDVAVSRLALSRQPDRAAEEAVAPSRTGWSVRRPASPPRARALGRMRQTIVR